MLQQESLTADLDAALTAATFVDDPYPTYRRLREEAPVHWSRGWGVWVTSRYADVLTVMRDVEHFSNAGRFESLAHQLDEQHWNEIDSIVRHNSTGLLQSDPPDHTRLRVLVRAVFTPRAIEALRSRVVAICDEYLDQVADGGPFDLISALATPLPITVMCELLGVPAEARDDFQRWATEIAGFQATGGADLEAARRSARAIDQLEAYFEGAVEERRVHPGKDLISDLIASEEAGDKLTHHELVNMCALLLNAGHETTRNLIGNAALTLLRHPTDLAAVIDDASLWPSTIEECLRYESPVQRGWRRVSADHQFDGQLMRSGQLVFAMLGAANRDPDRFENPESFDIRRQDNRHLAFGYGIHFCLGAPLARLEAPIALQALFTRFPHLSLGGPVTWNQNIHARGLSELILDPR